jgi:hypothetical protein
MCSGRSSAALAVDALAMMSVGSAERHTMEVDSIYTHARLFRSSRWCGLARSMGCEAMRCTCVSRDASRRCAVSRFRRIIPPLVGARRGATDVRWMVGCRWMRVVAMSMLTRHSMSLVALFSRRFPAARIHRHSLVRSVRHATNRTRQDN